MKRLAAVTVLAVLPLTAAPLVAHAAVPTCQGEPPTLVGEPGETLNGTAGRDVMVSRGASHVNAGDGDDLICITGSTQDGYRVRVTGGNGDDSVLVTGRNTVKVFLGDGRDSFAGGDEDNYVFGGDFDDDEFLDYRDDDPDTITTGGGDDGVTASNDDSVALGAGDDSLSWAIESGEAPAGNPAGGTGRNLIQLRDNTYDDAPGKWVLDSRSETLTENGEVRATWTHFTQFYVGVGGRLLDEGELPGRVVLPVQLRVVGVSDHGRGRRW